MLSFPEIITPGSRDLIPLIYSSLRLVRHGVLLSDMRCQHFAHGPNHPRADVEREHAVFVSEVRSQLTKVVLAVLVEIIEVIFDRVKLVLFIFCPDSPKECLVALEAMIPKYSHDLGCLPE
jgi:hypothetical protein